MTSDQTTQIPPSLPSKPKSPAKLIIMSLVVLALIGLAANPFFGFGRPEPVTASLLVGRYEVIGHPCPYRNLELFSNNVYQCECCVSDNWLKVEGQWKLYNNGRVALDDIYDSNGRMLGRFSMPTRRSRKQFYIEISDDASFKKLRN